MSEPAQPPPLPKYAFLVRRVVVWGSAVFAFAGWGVAVLSWVTLGHAAGVDPGFILGACVGITATITCCQSVVMPDMARIYALGIHRGLSMRPEIVQADPPRRLSAVR